jgi:hypothetical protein
MESRKLGAYRHHFGVVLVIEEKIFNFLGSLGNYVILLIIGVVWIFYYFVGIVTGDIETKKGKEKRLERERLERERQAVTRIEFSASIRMSDKRHLISQLGQPTHYSVDPLFPDVVTGLATLETLTWTFGSWLSRNVEIICHLSFPDSSDSDLKSSPYQRSLTAIFYKNVLLKVRFTYK